MKTEKELNPLSGYLFIFFLFSLIIGGLASVVLVKAPALLIPIVLLIALLAKGFFIVNPNSSKVMTLFGDYKGTVKKNGFFWANPFYTRQTISLRARNLDSEKIKVNDRLGNPIIIGAVVVWRVNNTAKAAFEVDDYSFYVRVQSDAAIRKLAGKYAYDNIDGEVEAMTLRSGGEQVNHELEEALRERLEMAGIEIIEARISHLAYSQEIAGAMLQRQQAAAIVAARQKIVEGAVGMVEMALGQLEKQQIVDLDEEKKASMVSNLLVVLCSDKSTTPVVNTGTLYQ